MRRFSLLVGMALLWVAQLVVVPFSTGQVAPVLADPSGDVTAARPSSRYLSHRRFTHGRFGGTRRSC